MHIQENKNYASLDILTGLWLKIHFFWDITLWHWAIDYRRFERKKVFILRKARARLEQEIYFLFWPRPAILLVPPRP